MLPVASRLVHRDDFTAVLRRGSRGGRPRLVVHLLAVDAGCPEAAGSHPPRAGLVVSRAVGGAVVRHRVARRLRHQLASRLDALESGSRVVVRALPAAAPATSAEIGADLDAGLAAARRREARR